MATKTIGPITNKQGKRGRPRKADREKKGATLYVCFPSDRAEKFKELAIEKSGSVSAHLCKLAIADLNSSKRPES